MPLPNLEFAGSSATNGRIQVAVAGLVHNILKQKGNWYYLSCGNVATKHPARKWILSGKPVTCSKCIKKAGDIP